MAAEIPSTCKAMVAVKTGGDLELRDVPVHKPEKGHILIKTIACGVCHSDEALRQGAFGDIFPLILGHEVIGDVVAVGPDETRWKVGDRVGGGWHGGHDRVCKQCNRGMFQLCASAQINGVTRDGGYSEYCNLRSEAVAAIPTDIDPVEAAPLMCAGVTMFNSIRNMHIPMGDTVAIQGLGGLGHLGIQYTRKMGYRTVALSSSDKKKDFAMKLGATDYIDASKQKHSDGLQAMGGASLIVVTAPNPTIIGELVNGLAGSGKLLVLAPVGDISVNTLTLVQKAASVHGWACGHGQDSEETIQFSQLQGVHCMVERVPFKDANKAFHRLETGEVRFRSVLTF